MRKVKDTYANKTQIIYKWKWGSFYPKFDDFYFVFGPASYFDSRWHIHCQLSQIAAIIAWPIIGMNWFALLLLIPFFIKPWGSLYVDIPGTNSGIDECEYPRYGFYFYGDKGHESVWFCWSRKTKQLFEMPWAHEWMRTSKLAADEKTWFHEVSKRYPGADLSQKIQKDWWQDEWKNKLWSETYDYTYVLRNGTVQKVKATIGVEEREWRQHWLRWTSLFSNVRRTIDITFSDEVGEGVHHWKGGTTGCGYELLAGETPEQCLRRMEKERKFSR